jgi:hypothetical protein
MEAHRASSVSDCRRLRFVFALREKGAVAGEQDNVDDLQIGQLLPNSMELMSKSALQRPNHASSAN